MGEHDQQLQGKERKEEALERSHDGKRVLESHLTRGVVQRSVPLGVNAIACVNDDDGATLEDVLLDELLPIAQPFCTSKGDELGALARVMTRTCAQIRRGWQI
jgi:hypothetical protein